MSQQGFPPGHSSRSPQASGPRRSSRHAGPSRDEQDWDQEAWNQQPWDARPGGMAVGTRSGWPGRRRSGRSRSGQCGPGQCQLQRRSCPAPATPTLTTIRRHRPARTRPAGRRPGPGRAGRSSRDQWVSSDPFRAADDDSEAPPWAGLSIAATRPGGTKLRPPEPQVAEQAPVPGRRPGRRRGRAAAARLRKSRRRVYVCCGTAVVVAVISRPRSRHHGRCPSTSAEDRRSSPPCSRRVRTVPSACHSVSTALLTSYLPGQDPQGHPGQYGGETQPVQLHRRQQAGLPGARGHRAGLPAQRGRRRERQRHRQRAWTTSC